MDWFKTNKLSLNNKKTKYTLFHKKFSKDDLPLKLPALKKADNNIKRKTEIKFLAIMLDEKVSREEHIHTIETKLVKNIELLYHAKTLLEEKSLKSCFVFTCIHSYLNYANIVLDSTYRTKLKTINFHQKHSVRIAFIEDKLTQSRPLLRTFTILKLLPN